MVLCIFTLKMSLFVRKPAYCICDNKDADQLRGNCEADQRLVFATWIVQSLFYLSSKFQASSHLQWVYSLVCVRPHNEAQIVSVIDNTILTKFMDAKVSHLLPCITIGDCFFVCVLITKWLNHSI